MTTKEAMIEGIIRDVKNILNMEGIQNGTITIEFSPEEITSIKANFIKLSFPVKEQENE